MATDRSTVLKYRDVQDCASGHRFHGVCLFMPHSELPSSAHFLQMLSMVTLSYFDTVHLEQKWCFAHPFGKSFRAGVTLNTRSVIFFEEQGKHVLCALLKKKKSKYLMIVEGLIPTDKNISTIKHFFFHQNRLKDQPYGGSLKHLTHQFPGLCI